MKNLDIKEAILEEMALALQIPKERVTPDMLITMETKKAIGAELLAVRLQERIGRGIRVLKNFGEIETIQDAIDNFKFI